MKYFGFILLYLLLSSCQDKNVVIIMDRNSSIDSVDVTILGYMDGTFADFTLDKENNYYDLPVKGNTFVSVSTGSESRDMYISPESEIKIKYDHAKGWKYSSYTDLTENKILESYDKALKKASIEFKKEFEKDMTEDEYNILIDQCLAPADQLVAQNVLPGILKTALDMRKQVFMNEFNFSRPAKLKSTMQKNSRSLGEIFLDEIDLSDPAVLSLAALRAKLIGIVRYGNYYKKDYDPVIEIKNSSSNDRVRDFLFYYLCVYTMQDNVGKKSSLAKAEDYKKHINSDYLKGRITNELAEAGELAPGAFAKDLRAYDTVGNMVSLSDFRGENLYIDFWFLGCGGCVSEKYYLKKLKEEYKDQNLTFISISIDGLEDKEKWKKFMDINNISGHQWITGDKLAQEVRDKYKIGSYPRFILIDRNGLLVSADAPRPSDEGIHQYFMDKIL